MFTSNIHKTVYSNSLFKQIKLIFYTIIKQHKLQNTIIFDSKNLQNQQLLRHQWLFPPFKIKNCCMKAHSHKLSNLYAIGCHPKISIHFSGMLLACGINSTPCCISETICATNDTICVNRKHLHHPCNTL